MKRYLWSILPVLGLAAIPAQSQTAAFNGFCDSGGRSAVTSGLNSTNKLQQVIPSCTVTVFLTGTTTKATIFKDTLNTPLGNPFTAAVLGSTAPGQWLFYATVGQGYDVVMSGGIAPNTYATPVTLTDLIIPAGGGGGSGCVVAGTASFILLDNGHGGCVDANGANIGVQAIDNSAGGMEFDEAGSGGFQVVTSYTGVSGLGITLEDHNSGITIQEEGTGGIIMHAGAGGYSITGGSDGFPGLINGTGLQLHSGGLTATLDDMQISSQTRHIQIKGGTVSLTDGYSALDTTALLSNDAFNIAVPRFSGTWMLSNGTLTANDCVQVNATGNGFIDSGAGCGGGGGGGAAFNAITSGSNTTATMVLDSGSSLATSGTGTNAATSVGGITVTGTPSANQVLTATSSSAANWQAPAAGSAFSAITSGTNTVAAMLLGTGGSLGVTGAGTIAATSAVALASVPSVCSTGQYASGVDINGDAICVPLPTQPASQYIAPQAMSGCGVEYVSGLQYTIGACTYSINGVIYDSPLTNVTLAAADPSNPRIDVIFVDTTQTVQTITGVPAVSPQQPVVDPSTQLELTFVLVPAAATTPGNTTLVDIYLEGVEWTGAKGGTNGTRVNLTSTSNPYSGTHDTEFGVGGTVTTTTFAGYTVPSAGTVDLANYNTLTLYARNKAAWPSTRSVTVQWFNGSTAKGTAVVVSNGAFGFDAVTNVSSYQQISIPTSIFGIAGVPVTSVRFTVSGTGAALTGFYLDQITLQGGSGGPSLPATLMNFKGPWSSTATYNPNDTVTSGGIGYVALTTNTNVAVTTAATWTPLGSGGGGGSLTSFAAPSGSWPTWLVPTVTNPSGPAVSLTVVANSIPYSALAGIGANTILGALTATTPSALAIPNCATAGSSALIWTSGVGFGCNSISGGGGGGNTTSTSLTNNFLPKANGVNSIIDSGAKDDGTAFTYTGSGTVNSIGFTEGTAATGAASTDIFYALASTHRWTMNNNNAGALTVVGIASAGSSGNCLQSAANGIDIVVTGAPCGSGSGNVSAGGTLTSNALILGAGTTAVAAIGSLGTTTTVLHGNAAGAPTFGAISLTADVSGVLPPANGGAALYLNWTFNSGAAATDASPRFLISHTGTIANCYVLTTASDGSTALTFDIFKNGSSIFSAPQTIAAATSPGTLTTLTPTTTSFTNNDKISINITSGTSSWIFTVSCK